MLDNVFAPPVRAGDRQQPGRDPAEQPRSRRGGRGEGGRTLRSPGPPGPGLTPPARPGSPGPRLTWAWPRPAARSSRRRPWWHRVSGSGRRRAAGGPSSPAAKATGRRGPVPVPPPSSPPWARSSRAGPSRPARAALPQPAALYGSLCITPSRGVTAPSATANQKAGSRPCRRPPNGSRAGRGLTRGALRKGRALAARSDVPEGGPGGVMSRAGA